MYWLRTVKSFQNDVEADTHDVLIGRMSPGETLTRIRFKYFLSSYNADNPLLTDDVVIAAGIITGGPIPTPPNFYPATSPSQEWIWWEGETQGIQVYYKAGTEAPVTESRGPQDRSERDVKAQRRNNTNEGQNIWFKTQSTIPGVQGQHFLGYSFSVGILQAF